MVFVEASRHPSLVTPELRTRGGIPAISILQLYETSYTDVSGMPSSSDRFYPELIKEINFEYQACPFRESQSRFPDNQPHQIPMSGLERRRLAHSYPAMLSTLAELRVGYITVIDRNSADSLRQLKAKELRSFLRALSYLPHYLTNRGINALPTQRFLPIEVITLSNSAAGTLGAYEAYAQVYGESSEDLEKGPDADRVIDAAEKSGAMVGKKTVCVASPAQMRHFIDSVVSGVRHPLTESSLTSLMSPGEIPSWIMFGNAAYIGHERISLLKVLDSVSVDSFESFLKRKHPNPRRLRQVSNSFLAQSAVLLQEINLQQGLVNLGLGREANGPEVTLDSLKSAGFRTVDLLGKSR